jgi:hypothetical protein|tara:strand:- start:28 stop:546 length:519 start_codon:yes stop_codon:yes gene_type:complete
MDSHDFHKLLLSRGTFFCYSGLLSEEVLSAISGIVREQVTDIDHDEDLTTRVFGIFIEQAQNIIRYSDERLAQGGIGTVAIGHTSEGFVVEAINPMKSDNMLSLKENLDKLQQMQPKDLRKAYKQRLREGPPEGSKGAGLGFIEIARKSSKFEFDFVESPELLFVLKAWIDP